MPENSPAGVNIGAPISATDADGDVLTYTLGGTDEASFDIDSSRPDSSSPRRRLNYEDAQSSYSVTVTADDGREGTDSTPINVTITVVDVDEQPAAPAPPVVTTGSTQGTTDETTTLEINWYAPENTGPAINDYDYRYKKTTETTWTEVDDSTSTDTNSRRSRRWKPTPPTRCRCARRAAVRDDGPWSLAAVRLHQQGGQRRAGVRRKWRTERPTTRTVAENTPSGQRVGAAMTAMDDNSTTLNYSLAGDRTPACSTSKGLPGR